MAPVLVVDDDQTVREVVVSYLCDHEHTVDEAADGEDALRQMRETPAGLVVLDLMLPGIDGLEGCRRLRLVSDVPVIMLTALGAETDRVAGLELGADDYVTKPFSPRELALRVDSVLRRTDPYPHTHPSSRTVSWSSTAPDISPPAPASRSPSRHVSWSCFAGSSPTPKSPSHVTSCSSRCGVGASSSPVTVHVRRLREKVEDDPTRPVRLLTVWGVGYRWEGVS
jgi:DNA-binding response OmpR family regulator